MQTLQIHTERSQLREYLQLEFKEVAPETYQFTQLSRGVDVLTRYLHNSLKTTILKKLQDSYGCSNETIHLFLLDINPVHERPFYVQAQELIEDYLRHTKEKEVFYIDGFETFRLKRPFDSMFDFYQKELEAFMEDYYHADDGQSLREYMESLDTLTERIYIETNSFHNISIKGDNFTLFEANVSESQDISYDIGSLIIQQSPKEIIINDEHLVLSKYFYQLMQQIFQERMTIVTNS